MTGSLIQLISVGQQDKELIGNPEISFFVSAYKRYTNFEKRQHIIKSYNFKSPRLDRTAPSSEEINVSYELPKGPDLVQEMFLKTNIKINNYINNFSLIKLLSLNEISITVSKENYDSNPIKKDKFIYFRNDIYNFENDEYKKIILKNTAYKVYQEVVTQTTDTTITQTIKVFNDSTNTAYSTLLRLFKYNNNSYVPIDQDIIYIVNTSLDKDLSNIIKEVDIKIGGLVIDKHYSQWFDIYNELFETKHFIRESLNNDLAINNIVDDFSKITIYIPLRFWFNNNPGLAFPLISLPFDEITINFILDNRIGDFYQIIDPDLLANFIYLDKDERLKFKNQKLEYLIEQVQSNGIQINTSEKLTFNCPIKAIFWVIYNGYNNQNCSLKLNNHFVFNRPPNYFHLIQPYESKLGNGFTMNTSTRKWTYNYSKLDEFHNIGMYSFALNTSKYQPSGSCNFSLIDSAILDFKNIVSTSSSIYKIYVYAISYNLLKIENQTVSLLFY